MCDLTLEHVHREDNNLQADLWYPRSAGAINSVTVGLVDVRSTDGIRVSFSFDRNGWVIQQASRFEWPPEDEVCDMDWQEVAFIPSWNRYECPAFLTSQTPSGYAPAPSGPPATDQP
jgi:hypothetical protein